MTIHYDILEFILCSLVVVVVWPGARHGQVWPGARHGQVWPGARHGQVWPGASFTPGIVPHGGVTLTGGA
jgi:hypothetical protein